MRVRRRSPARDEVPDEKGRFWQTFARSNEDDNGILLKVSSNHEYSLVAGILAAQTKGARSLAVICFLASPIVSLWEQTSGR